MKDCWSVAFGIKDYDLAQELQKTFCFRRSYGDIVDTLLFMEHNHIYTMGSGTKPLDMKNIDRKDSRIPIRKTDRGGGATYHGPGQLVVYPILKLDHDISAEKYLRLLEDVIIATLDEFGIFSKRKKSMTGVWQSNKKIASIGVKVVQGVTKHGFSINASCDLSFFDGINACGFDRPAISMAEIFGCKINMASLKTSVERNFGKIFERKMISFDESELDKRFGDTLAAKIGI